MRRLALVAALVLGLLCLTGCLSVPTSGPVVVTRLNGDAGDETGFAIVPAGPTKNATPGQIVEGFLDAMEATPVSATVAREFLGPDLATSWDPSRETIAYTTRTPSTGRTHDVVQLSGANWLDRRGTWRGPLPASRSRLRLDLAKVHGQWRITRAPDALVVPESWFDNRFTQMSLYFFDSTARILVPEPVFVPVGAQQVSTLVRDLLAGPDPMTRGVLRTFLPAGGSETLSVPVSSHGVAQLDIGGAATRQNKRTQALMQAQLAWTLRQVPTIGSIKVTLSGSGAAAEADTVTFSASAGSVYDPDGYGASTAVYGVRHGVLGTLPAAGQPSPFTPVLGPWGKAHDVSRVAVALAADRAAGIASDGHRVLYGPIGSGGSVAYAPVSGTRLLRPAWDHSERLWLVDRTSHGAVVEYLPPGRKGTALPPRVVHVPGVSGRQVHAFLVSRDGTRLVAVVSGAATDRIVVSRLLPGPAGGGGIASGTPAVTISDPAAGAVRFGPLGWSSPTTVFATQLLVDSSVVRSYSVDGSGYGSATLTVGDRISALVSSPEPDAPIYGIGRHALLDLSGRGVDRALPAGVRSAFFVG